MCVGHGDNVHLMLDEPVGIQGSGQPLQKLQRMRPVVLGVRVGHILRHMKFHFGESQGIRRLQLGNQITADVCADCRTDTGEIGFQEGIRPGVNPGQQKNHDKRQSQHQPGIPADQGSEHEHCAQIDEEEQTKEVFAAPDGSGPHCAGQHQKIHPEGRRRNQDNAQPRAGECLVLLPTCQNTDKEAHQDQCQRQLVQPIQIKQNPGQVLAGAVQLVIQRGTAPSRGRPTSAELEDCADQPTRQHQQGEAVLGHDVLPLLCFSVGNQAQQHHASGPGGENTAGGQIGENGEVNYDVEAAPGGRCAGFQEIPQPGIVNQAHDEGGVQQSGQQIIIVAIQVNAVKKILIAGIRRPQSQKMHQQKQAGDHAGRQPGHREAPAKKPGEAPQVAGDGKAYDQSVHEGLGGDVVFRQGHDQVGGDGGKEGEHHLRENLGRVPFPPDRGGVPDVG